MTLQEETLQLGEERDRLDEQLDTLADKLVDADAGTASAAMLKQTANDVQSQLAGVSYLIDEHGADATVTVAGLDAGMFARVEDRAADLRAESSGAGNNPGSYRNVYASVGLLDAPFVDLEDVSSERDRVDQTLPSLASQPVGVAKWIESRVNDLTGADEGNWTPLRERLAARQSES